MAAQGMRLLLAFAIFVVAAAVVAAQDEEREQQLVDVLHELLSKLTELVEKLSNQCK